MLAFFEELRRTLETIPVSGQQNIANMLDVLRNLDNVINDLRSPPKVEKSTTTQTIELPVDPQLTGGENHASDQ